MSEEEKSIHSSHGSPPAPKRAWNEGEEESEEADQAEDSKQPEITPMKDSERQKEFNYDSFVKKKINSLYSEEAESDNEEKPAPFKKIVTLDRIDHEYRSEKSSIQNEARSGKSSKHQIQNFDPSAEEANDLEESLESRSDDFSSSSEEQKEVKEKIAKTMDPNKLDAEIGDDAANLIEFRKNKSTPPNKKLDGEHKPAAKKIFLENDRDDEYFDEDIDKEKMTSMSTANMTTSMIERKKKKRKLGCCRNKLRRDAHIPKCLILPSDIYKQYWDIFTSILVILISFIVPYRVAFIDEEETDEWTYILLSLDCCFFIDICLNFFTVYINENREHVVDHKLIIRHYVFTWFFVDLVSTIPFGMILNVNSYNSLARVSRVSRIYKIIKIIRLTRMLKIAKERSKLSKYLNEVLSFSIGFERFIFFLVFMVIFVHLAACAYMFIGGFTSDEIESWYFQRSIQDDSNFDLYVTCLYFVFTTITTVGFGDISGGTNEERIFCTLLMILGVLAFTFTTSSLSTLITNMDSRNAKLKTRISQLNALNAKYNLSLRLYHKIEKVLKFDHSKSETFEISFLNDCPQRLKIELSFCMYKTYIEKLPFFQEKNGHFIAFVCPTLTPQFVHEEEIIYKEGDIVNEIYFLLSGKVGMVLSIEAKKHPYMYIEEGHYFGEIDMLNHTAIGSKKSKKVKLDKKRNFTTVAITNCELLLWSKKNIYLADSEFDDVIRSIFETAERRYLKAVAAKKEAFEYYNSLQHKKELGFTPVVTRAQEPSENIFQNRKNYYNDDEDEVIMEEFDDFDEDDDGKNEKKKEDKQKKNTEKRNLSPENRRLTKPRLQTSAADSLGTPNNKNLFNASLKKQNKGVLGRSLHKNHSTNLFSGKKEYSGMPYSGSYLDNDSASSSADNEELKKELEQKDRDLKIARAEIKSMEKKIKYLMEG
ncbi:unnamed protein product [Moneuplotes crassus]|uniref:Cyclic nucleotide-binding domain-containing protein n=2 Tax=Euplotes crassus TaxID=5936 RepID=A0AAD1XZ90_EUPCR|nr:unnamed protein product [Moneuplotes crassus]